MFASFTSAVIAIRQVLGVQHQRPSCILQQSVRGPFSSHCFLFAFPTMYPWFVLPSTTEPHHQARLTVKPPR
ncbi:hypothetical protein B0H65DRAFT_463885 [Neurospora tetraspora]|uniref:Uncharacterized protein n=1 Tax=Neurospora tetraspora TaxID=94610 RepID=A0AAE0JDY5_9PEZI|nr:hypothetical protein B0H65DRAFT_463885 [Neurospora tetraspora]